MNAPSYDTGGGTFEASNCTIQDGIFEVKATELARSSIVPPSTRSLGVSCFLQFGH